MPEGSQQIRMTDNYGGYVPNIDDIEEMTDSIEGELKTALENEGIHISEGELNKKIFAPLSERIRAGVGTIAEDVFEEDTAEEEDNLPFPIIPPETPDYRVTIPNEEKPDEIEEESEETKEELEEETGAKEKTGGKTKAADNQKEEGQKENNQKQAATPSQNGAVPESPQTETTAAAPASNEEVDVQDENAVDGQKKQEEGEIQINNPAEVPNQEQENNSETVDAGEGDSTSPPPPDGTGPSPAFVGPETTDEGQNKMDEAVKDAIDDKMQSDTDQASKEKSPEKPPEEKKNGEEQKEPGNPDQNQNPNEPPQNGNKPPDKNSNDQTPDEEENTETNPSERLKQIEDELGQLEQQRNQQMQKLEKAKKEWQEERKKQKELDKRIRNLRIVYWICFFSPALTFILFFAGFFVLFCPFINSRLKAAREEKEKSKNKEETAKKQMSEQAKSMKPLFSRIKALQLEAQMLRSQLSL